MQGKNILEIFSKRMILKRYQNHHNAIARMLKKNIDKISWPYHKKNLLNQRLTIIIL